MAKKKESVADFLKQEESDEDYEESESDFTDEDYNPENEVIEVTVGEERIVETTPKFDDTLVVRKKIRV